MPSFQEAYTALRHSAELALGLQLAPSLDETQTPGGRADGAFSLEVTWNPHGEHPGRWASDHPGRVEGTLGVSWQRRVNVSAETDTESELTRDHDRLVSALVFGETMALAEITVRFRGARQIAAPSREWRRGRCDFEFEHYYDEEAA